MCEIYNGELTLRIYELYRCTMRHYYAPVNSLHDGRPNWVFADGHAQAMTPRQTIEPNFRFNLRDQYPLGIYRVGVVNSEEQAQQKLGRILRLWGL